jgi:hypothetical protein
VILLIIGKKQILLEVAVFLLGLRRLPDPLHGIPLSWNDGKISIEFV